MGLGSVGLSPGRLTALVALVLGAHLLALQATPVYHMVNEPLTPMKLVTRVIDLKAAAPSAVAPAPVTRAVAVAPRAASVVQPPADMPAPAKAHPSAEANTPEPSVGMPTPTAEVQAAPVTAAVPIAPALEPAATPAREPQPPAPPSAAAEPRVAASPLPVPLGGGAGLSAVSIPGSLVLKYVATGESAKRQYSGEATLVWRHDGSAYEARLEMKVSLITARAMSSVGRITPEGLAPTRFGDRRFTEQAAHFDRPGARITFSNNAPAAAMLGGAQDRLSLLVQLGAMLAGDSKKFPSGTSIAVQTASDREASIWTFQVGETQTLQTPGGNVEAIKLTRKLRHEFDQKIELWLAPSLEYLPVRILQTEANGNFVDTRWRASERP